MMKKLVLCCLVLISTTVCAVPKLVYNGDTLQWNTEWKRTQCGAVHYAVDIYEVSGIACSRVTPGYIWMQSDNEDKINGREDNDHIIATDEKGEKLYTRINFLNLEDSDIRYWDWEDMSGGVYDGRNYLFIGAFGDNDEVEKHYSIIYFEEPAIVEGQVLNLTPSQIRYQYPDGKSHNAEAIMYDNREQMIYIITKVYYNVCQVFSLPFRLDYGDEKQTLEYICDLGVRSDLGESDKNQPYKGFHLVTGADISPDGSQILIKNHNNIVASYSWVLLWERLDGESVSETLKRQPEPLKCYSYEWQGEAICWLDTTTFYTTSDSDGEPPIYKYTKKAQGVETVKDNNGNAERAKVLVGNAMYIRSKEGMYTLDGRKVK